MIKKILYILLSILSISCLRKPLYLQYDNAVCVNTYINDNIDDVWNKDWRDSLKYKIDINDFWYDNPDSLKLVIFNDKNCFEYNIKPKERCYIKENLDNCNILIYNETTNIILKEYYIESINDSINNFTKQPGDIFSEYILNSYVIGYEYIYVEGRNIQLYNINAILNPISYIYLFQFIIVNDDNSHRIEAKNIVNYAVSGMVNKKSLINGESISTETYQITSNDIKEEQERGDSTIYISRMTTLGVLQENTSWINHQNGSHYLIVNINTYNYGNIRGIIDITHQIIKNPHGGIITIKIFNSDLKEKGEEGSDFGIDITEWKDVIYDIPL